MKCKYNKCQQWEPETLENECDNCADGRYLEAVNIYASTCDNCGELTNHDTMIMDKETQLGYCEKCAIKIELIKEDK